MMQQAPSYNDFLSTKTQTFEDLFSDSIEQKKINLQMNTIGVDYTYAIMHLVSQKILLDIAAQLHDGNTNSKSVLLDVGSTFSFISFASTFFDVISLEPRNNQAQIHIPNVCSISNVVGEAQNLPIKDNQLNVITSLHAIEHFGLGRYGDQVDYFGDYRAMQEFSRVLAPGGYLLTGVPTSKKSRLEFNEQRVYKATDFDKMVESAGLKKKIGLITYAPGHNKNGHLMDAIESIETYDESFTPPVYVAVYKKEEV